MALTANDIQQIKTSVVDVVEPRFAETHKRLELTNQRIEERFGQLKVDVDNLTAATNRKFHTVFTDIAVTREDLHVVKQMVSEHGFRLARLENKRSDNQSGA
ncbi:hypothetical protein EPO04_03005 [Patescibacteria group bacterium]|nr:MAG: hypothetical protein EPO04_03005 [Patescibacteria group bacterium]